MNKQPYHKPELRRYGNISAMTQNSGNSATRGDGGSSFGTGKTKTS
jgi:hypothetical protein